MRAVFRTIGARAPNESQEVAWLELSGGVRSLPQVPWWNAERRAAPSVSSPAPPAGEDGVGAVPQRETRRLRNNVYRRSASFFFFSFFLRSPRAEMNEVKSGIGI